MVGRRASLSCLIFIALLHSGPPCQADQFDDAQAYFDSGDARHGIELLNSIAETGDAATQYRAGNKLISYDDSGIRWIESAAEHGYAEAQVDMGMACATGTLVPQDLPRSFMWYSLALQGSLDASARDRASQNLKKIDAAMTSRERERAEQLIKDWKPK